ncbi:MAG: hypothetical protein ABIS50_14105 [Luteolibacter sp.]|uniref:hypothetical protein n=1 Tax=Luteolibacter sp. TaxID=1962973 RepID=UPI003266E292
MKIPIVWPAVILAVLIGLCLGDHRKLRRLSDRHAELTATLANRTDSSSAGRIPRDSRAHRGAQTLAAECLELGKNPEVRSGMPREQRREAELRKMELLNRLDSMNPAEWEEFLAEIRTTAEPGAKLPQFFLYGALQELSEDHPKIVLDFFSQTLDGLAEKSTEEGTVSVALGRWIGDDPAAALKWMESNPRFMTDEVKQKVVCGAAANDPKLAFKLIGELGCKRPEYLASFAAFSARTAGVRTDMVAALRDYIPSIPEEKLRKRTQHDAFENLAGGIVAVGFENGLKWINETGLTHEELAGFADGLTSHVKGLETGRWLEWAGTALQGNERDETVKVMMFYWGGADPSGAESWLAGTKESPQRDLAIQGYVDAVSSSEPEVAIEWALALPTGKPREGAFKLIYKKWPRHDAAQKAAADAFAEEHGIK